MKKSMMIAAVAAGILIFGGGSAFAAGQLARSNAITEEAARNFAFVDAGILPEHAVAYSTEFDYEKGKFVYEIEFAANGIYYEYTVDSSNGTILGKKTKVLPPLTAAQEQPAAAESQPTQSEGQTQPAATENTPAQPETKPAQPETKPAQPETKPAQPETKPAQPETKPAQPETKPAQPETTPAQPETKPAQPETKPAEEPKPAAPVQETKPQAPQPIGIDKAKSIALSRAGLSAGSVVFSKAKLDYDDGRAVYEIEFYVYGQKEYDYEIDAYSGKILEEDIEPWEYDD